MSKNLEKMSKMTKNHQKFEKTGKIPSKISKNRQKYLKTLRKPSKYRKTVKNVEKPFIKRQK